MIVTQAPPLMWGPDVTQTSTEDDGTVNILAAIDHYIANCIGMHVAKRGDRFEALEPIRQAVDEHCGGFSAGVARGIQLHHDHGSVYMSDDFQRETRFLGMESSPAFVRQLEGNGCIERFFRTLKEQLLWVSVTSKSFALPCVSSATATTITGFFSGSTTAHRSRPCLTSSRLLPLGCLIE